MNKKKKKAVRIVTAGIAFLLVISMVLGICFSCTNTADAAESMWAEDYVVHVDGREVLTSIEVEQETDPQDEVQAELSSEEETAEGRIVVSEEEYARVRDNGDGSFDLLLGGYRSAFDNQLYFSLRDLAAVLSGTEKQFDFYLDYNEGCYRVISGEAYSAAGGAEDPEPETDTSDEFYALLKEHGCWVDIYGNWFDKYDEPLDIEKYADEGDIIYYETEAARPENVVLESARNYFLIDGRYVQYFTYQLSDFEDLYMSVLDIGMALDIMIEEEENGELHIYTDRGFSVDMEELSDNGYFSQLDGVMLCDATTNEVLYAYNESNITSIASTSKLMTYVIVQRYLELGRISLDDMVYISADVEARAFDGNGVLELYEGMEVRLDDLLAAMLVRSSNEAAQALAEYVGGSEERFVEMMNEMAAILGLDSAVFYNSHGLQVLTDGIVSTRVQNSMTAEDMYTLARFIMHKYPGITDYTRLMEVYLDSLGYSVVTTNSLLYNMDGVVGLKTGTTDEAGKCLVAADLVQRNDGEHVIISVVFGTLYDQDRIQSSQLLLSYAEQLAREEDAAEAAEEG